MNLDQFSKAWQDLRDAVMGRGLGKPEHVPQALYDRVANATERWQAWYPRASLLDQVAFELTFPSFVEEYRALAAEARKLDLDIKEPGQGSLETVTRTAASAAAALSGGARATAVLAVALAVPLTVWLVLGKGKRRARR